MVQSTRPTTGTPLITRHLYDGVRRIQDHLDDGGGFTLESEYIWGFGGAVDELIAHYDGSGEPFYAIHDLSGDLVALCDLNGSAGAARVLAQWTYDAYGSVLTAEYPVLGAQPPPLRIGHKGLFFDRLTGDDTDPQLWPHEAVVYHVRNRTYKPDIGRWLQRDPNETAQVVLAMAHGGLPVLTGEPSIGFEEWYGDGHNLYGYVDASPVLGSDPTGLFSLLGTAGATSFGSGWNIAEGNFGLSVVSGLERSLQSTADQQAVIVDLMVGSIAGTLAPAAFDAALGLAGSLARHALRHAGHGPGGVWRLGHFERGRVIHAMLGENLPSGFKTIDIWKNGIATSIKSIDATSKTYQNPAALQSKAEEYIRKVANYSGGRRGAVSIKKNEIRGRQLILAVPEGFISPSQQSVLRGLHSYAGSRGVMLRVRGI